MKLNKSLMLGALALGIASIASADQVLHITGSTAFRGAAVAAIENSMIGAYTVAYQGAQPTVDGTELGVNNVVIRGTMTGVAGITTVKCAWAGSTGGILCNAKQLDIATIPGAVGWMSGTNIGSTTSITVGNKTMNAVPSPSFALETFTPAETQKSDVNMADSLQASTILYASPVLGSTKVGVIVFEWVANNGSPAGFSNLTTFQANTIFGNGGVYLSQVTGNPLDTLPVYGVGRNFDSGTRLSQLTETGLGTLGTVQQMQVTNSGTLGAGGAITGLGLYLGETIFPAPYTRTYGDGESGYSSGGTVADVLATPGSSTAPSLGRDGLYGTNCWLVGYLGRNDANRAVKKTAGANTAHRLTFNGVTDWTGASDSQVSVYNDAAVTEGLYQGWEYEFLQTRTGLAGTRLQAATQIATRIHDTDATVSGIKETSMNVSRDYEGGPITHN
jgi:hypothetical protein